MSEPGTHLKDELRTRAGDSGEVEDLRAKSTAPLPDSSQDTAPGEGNDQGGLIGKLLSDRYRILRCLGAGAMGEVYEGLHTHMKKSVAVKVLHPEMMGELEVVERFKREAQAAAHIEHPHVCAATDFGELDNGAFFMVMEYLEGKSLDEALIDAGGRFEPERALRVVRQIAEALTRSHELEIIHRDLKPANIMLVDRDGDTDFVKVLDFGVAHVVLDSDVDTQLTQSGLIYGTLTYMPPEQAAGAKIDARSDLYAVGVILFELLLGRPPFVSHAPMKLASMHMMLKPPTFAEVTEPLGIELELDPRIEQLTMKLLEKQPDDRYSSATELIAALDLLLPQDPEISQLVLANLYGKDQMSLPPAPTAAKPSQIWLFLGMGGVIVLLIATLLLVVLLSGEDDKSSSEKMGIAHIGATLDDGSSPTLPSEFDAAIAKIDARKANEAVALLEAMDDSTKKGAFYPVVLGYAYANKKKWAKAFSNFELALEREPRLANNDMLLRGVFKNFNQKSKKNAELSIAFLTKHPSDATRAHLAISASSGRFQNIRKRAGIVLEETGQNLTLLEWEGLVIELRKSRSCDERKPLVLRLGEIGHVGALPVQKYWQKQKNDCDFFGDCMDCVRKELELIIKELKAKE